MVARRQPSRVVLVATSVLFVAHALPAQVSSSGSRPARPQKHATAVRVPTGAIRLDGRPDETAWADVPLLNDFVQKDPVEGAEPTDHLEVRIAYDDEALYVATRVRSKDPSKIQAPMSRRDNIHQAEHIWISLDTYMDQRTAYSFAVAASGVRGDWYHPRDNEFDIDDSFDPVWQAVASRDSAGWTAEMRIPFSQLRFNAADEQRWGVNFDYWSPSKNEDVFWIPVPKKETGWSSWMGRLTGIRGIKPTRRVEVLPYVASNSTMNDNRNLRDPFDDGRNLESRVGGDLKMGVGPNLTLEATVNPDFGQVEADPAEVNLSAFETFFSERRPFFIEGNQILAGNGPSYYYSRRIGAPPRGGAAGDFVAYPTSSTIISAAKLTGQLAGRTSLGVLGAVTGREFARSFDSTTGRRADTLVAPITSYGVATVSQQFGANQSTIGAIVTGVQRDIDVSSPLANVYNTRAFTGGADWNLRFRGGAYVLGGFAGMSRVMGSATRIASVQRSSARYFQRPDARSYHFDSTRTSLTGGVGYLFFQKVTGRHWLYSAETGFESPGLELNDLGRISTADGKDASVDVTYRETVPSRLFRSYYVELNQSNEWNFDNVRQFGTIRGDAGATFRNFWNLSLTARHDFQAQDERLTRGGPLMGTPYYNVGIISLSNAASSKTRWQGRVYYGKDEFGTVVNRLSGLISFKPGPRWDFSVTPNFLRAQNPHQYFTTRDDGRPETQGKRYIFGFLDQTTFTSVLRLNYALKPDLTVEMYGEPFAVSGRWNRFSELTVPRALHIRLYGTDGTTAVTNPDGSVTVTDTQVPAAGGGNTQFTLPFSDFNVRSWRSNLVLRWEYKPGATVYVVWQQNRSADVPNGEFVSFGSLVDPFRRRVGRYGYDDLGVTHQMTNFFAIKLNYWLPM
ncbi:MAG TPA: DUF5916 domain-containing protein [Gemmatimonadaceae bacterium]|nr:DUF5916 domain-containing protein [Gemmatimonadaceae bacterium]